MKEAIGDLLPSAFAVALSPIPIIAVVLVLGAPMVSINSAGGRAAGARAAPGGEMTYPHLDKPGRCAWCGGPVSPGERFCSRYCGRARSAWSNVPFSESLGEELTPREPEQPRTVDTPGGPPLNR